MVERIQRWLSAKRAPLVIIVLALALVSPALLGGFTLDDHMHRLALRSDPGVSGLESKPFDLFSFADGDEARNRELMDVGIFPWWSDPQARLAFWRPVSCATHVLDHALWPDSATAMLAHNLVWFAIALVMVWWFYRRFIDPRWLAALALLIYAIDDARGPPVSWIANRNAMIAIALALPVLLLYDRWRTQGWSPGAWLAPLMLIPALLAGESAIGIGAYLGAHALHLDRSSWASRARALAPFVVVVVVWRIAYVGLGYGVHGSGIYIDAGSDPVAFAGAIAHRLPLLLLGQIALPWSDLSVVYPLIGSGVLTAMVLVALGFIALFTIATMPLLRKDPVSRFMATGMVLAALPICSTFAADRLLWFVGLGGAGLVARLIGAVMTERAELGRTRVRRWFAIAMAAVLVLINVALAPLMLLSRSQSMINIDAMISRGIDSVPKDASIAGKTLILLNSPADPMAAYIQVTRQSRGEPRPARLRWLATGMTPIRVEGVDERTLRVRPEGGFVAQEIDWMLHDPRRDFRVGQRIELTGLVIEVESLTPDGRPDAILAHFGRPLADSGLIWMRWGNLGFVPYEPPSPGNAHVVPAVDYHALLTGDAPDNLAPVVPLPLSE